MTGESEQSGETDESSTATDPKTTEDSTEIDRTVPPEQWEEVGRRALTTLLDDRRRAVNEAVGELTATIDYGAPVDETHLERLRDAIEGLELLAEHDCTELVPDAEPFERTAGRVPFGRMAAALDVELDGLNRALAHVESDGSAAGEAEVGESGG